MHTTIRRALRVTLAAALAVAPLVAPARCATWIVDVHNGPGAHFTSIPPAIAAASPGDVILVRTGVYASGFTLSRGITILGQGTVRTGTDVAVVAVPAGEVAVLCGLYPLTATRVHGCAGTVLLQTFDGPVTIEGSADVRVLGRRPYPPTNGLGSVVVGSSRVQIVQSEIAGPDGLPADCFHAHDGAAAIRCTDAARVHVALTFATGGAGGPGFPHCGTPPGAPGPGLYARGPSGGSPLELILTGSGASVFVGGSGGGYSMDLADNVRAWSSGMTYLPGPPHVGPGSTLVLLPPREPTLELIGTPAPGATITLRLCAAPGVAARLNLGAVPLVEPQPNILVESLVAKQRSFDRGLVPPSGVLDTPWFFHPGAPLGKLLIFQAKVTDPSTGAAQKSNSIEAVVR